MYHKDLTMCPNKSAVILETTRNLVQCVQNVVNLHDIYMIHIKIKCFLIREASRVGLAHLVTLATTSLVVHLVITACLV